MNEQRSRNSLIFLTTLSVYLGLVLVGSCPSVLAQAATTPVFDVKSEIVVEDDLDKKPDDDLFADEIVALVNKLDQLSIGKKFDWNAKSRLTIEGLAFCESDNSPSYLGSSSGLLSEEIEQALDDAGIRIGRKLFRRKADLNLGSYYASGSETIHFQFTVENKELTINARIGLKSAQGAQSFANAIEWYLSRPRNSGAATKAKIVTENTKAKVTGEAILLVTRLPRASIDELLAR